MYRFDYSLCDVNSQCFQSVRTQSKILIIKFMYIVAKNRV